MTELFVQADANRYHIECAYSIYGSMTVGVALNLHKRNPDYREVVQKPFQVACWPKDKEGNIIGFITASQLREGIVSYNTCGKCLHPLVER